VIVVKMMKNKVVKRIPLKPLETKGSWWVMSEPIMIFSYISDVSLLGI
jgi:hypothetical protein